MKIIQINITDVLTPSSVVLLQKLVFLSKQQKFWYFIAHLSSTLKHDNICYGLTEAHVAVHAAAPLDTHTCTHVHAMVPIPVMFMHQ